MKQVNGKLQQGRLGQVKLHFHNPLEVPLTRCQVSLECAGVVREMKEKVPEVGPKADFSHNVLVYPRKKGEGTLVATFGSEEMIDVYGSCKIIVE